jgi:outer membrane lipoprotein-sorting protein
MTRTLVTPPALLTLPVFVAVSLLAPGVSTPAGAQAWGQCPASVRDLADKSDRISRGDSSEGIMAMRVYKRGIVSMRMKVWSKGRDKFLAKILAPSQLRGMSTLKSGDNLWNYLPKMDRILKLGASMMGGSWMGSHFTNDDLVKETDLRKHYTCTSYKDEGKEMVITVKPKPNAPVVWGSLVMRIQKDTAIPIWTRFHDERGTLKRTMRFEAVQTMGGRTFPTRMVLQPEDAPSERTEVSFHRMKFDHRVDDSLFTLQGLKR